MSTNDFFAKVDKRMSEIKQGEKEATDAAQQNSAFLAEVVTRLTSKVEEYEKQLLSRGIKVDKNISKSGISLTMKYKDGGHHGVRIGRSIQSKDNRIEVTNSCSGDDGKDYTSTSGQSYDRSTWTDDVCTSAIEKCIKDYLFYASKHGGL